MSEQINIVVKSHLKTTNIYVKRNIVAENIKSIEARLNSRQGFTVSKGVYWDIVAILKNQKSILRALDQEIKHQEQSSFRFGS